VLRYAIRRILWGIPTLIGVSLLVFFLTSLLPDPGGDTAEARAEILARDPSAYDAMDERRRERFLDLPRFFNPQPADVRTRSAEAIDHLVANDAQAAMAAHTLGKLGGAALPYVLPKLDNLAPAARGRVAVALAPVAARMGLVDENAHAGGETATTAMLNDPLTAATFWTRFWEDRTLEFTEPAVRRAVDRLTMRATDARQKDIEEVDTYALPELMETLQMTTDPAIQEQLTSLAAHATEHPVTIPPNADAAFRAHVVQDWMSWWYVHRTEFDALSGPERVAATFADTRYGKWVGRAATGELGVSVRDGEPIAKKLRERAPITMALTLIAMLASYLIAIPIALVSAWRRGSAIDRGLAFGLFALYSLPTFWTAELFVRLVPHATMNDIASGSWSGSRLIFPTIALTLASLATVSRYQRAAMLEVLNLDYIRTARAKGVSLFSLLVKHALRNAIVPTVTLAGLELPSLLGSAFIVEEIFGLPGLGYESLRAVEAHDTSWLIAMILFAAVMTTVGVLASDVAYGLLDPRVRELVLQRRARASW
jgi:ABC-type dipeptide/oligopeptide/nickel transport system permease component